MDSPQACDPAPLAVSPPMTYFPNLFRIRNRREYPTTNLSPWDHSRMDLASSDGFHKIKRVRITHGVPSSAGFFRTSEKVEVRLPASAVGDKSALCLLIDPAQYAGTRDSPGVAYYAGGATFWLYKDSVFADFKKRKNPEVQRLADEMLASPVKTRKTATTSRVPARRQTIPNQVKIDVWQRDSGRCVECGSNSELEFDHIISLKMGGANTFRNLQLLCGPCNRSKGAAL